MSTQVTVDEVRLELKAMKAVGSLLSNDARSGLSFLELLISEIDAAEAVLREVIKECTLCGGDGVEVFIVDGDADETEACPACASARAYFTQRGKLIEGA